MLALLAAVGLLSLVSCGDDSQRAADEQESQPLPEREVVVYVSADEAVARPILDAFTAESGIKVRVRFDGENAKTTALAGMLRQERDAPRCDVFWSSESLALARLGRETLTAPWRSRRADALPDGLHGESGRWYGFAPRMRVLVFDPARTASESIPQSMMDLAQPGMAGRVAIADPRFGTTRTHVAALAALMDRDSPGAFAKWIDAFAANQPLLVAGGNAAVVDAVFRGEAMFGLTDSDDFYAAVGDGASLAVVPIRQFTAGREGGGPLLIPNTVALVSGAPHPEEASELMDFLLRREVTWWLHQSRSGNFVPTDLQEDGNFHRAAPTGIPEFPPAQAAIAGRERLEKASDCIYPDESGSLESEELAVANLLKACASGDAK